MGTMEAQKVVLFREFTPEGCGDGLGTHVDECMKVVFPNSTHMLCSFHISKNVSMKCKKYVKSVRQ